jgi:RNase H-fold protein (predicted Holliday junction resolvase)
MAHAAREMEEFFAHKETDEWNQARQDAAAALQRAMDKREGALIPVGRPYPLDGHLHGTASARATQAQQVDQYASEMLARVHDEAVSSKRAQQAQRAQ